MRGGGWDRRKRIGGQWRREAGGAGNDEVEGAWEYGGGERGDEREIEGADSEGERHGERAKSRDEGSARREMRRAI